MKMTNLVIVPAKKRRFNPYKVVEWAGYVIAAGIVISCMTWVGVNFTAWNTPGMDFPWWSYPIGMIGTLGWVALMMAAFVLLVYSVYLVGEGYRWLRQRGREWDEVSD